MSDKGKDGNKMNGHSNDNNGKTNNILNLKILGGNKDVHTTSPRKEVDYDYGTYTSCWELDERRAYDDI